MTYNIHGCVGRDGRCQPERVAQVIRSLSPDVVALQEVDVGQGRSGGHDQARLLAELTELSAHFTSARALGEGHYGNAILTRHPYELRAEGILPVLRGEVRAAQWLRLSLDHGYLDVVNTHLGLHFRERWLQFRALFAEQSALLPPHPAAFPALSGTMDRLILCGDFNSGALSPIYFWLKRRLSDAQTAGGRSARATWPACYPLLRLDHVWVGKELRVEHVEVPRDRLTRTASDHLPIVVDLLIRTSETQAAASARPTPLNAFAETGH
jgi:endonuclease/exonuclease/phosphatase family metal-dependent hydrolase